MFYLGTHIYIKVFSEMGDRIYVSFDFICYKESITYYVISLNYEYRDIFKQINSH